MVAFFEHLTPEHFERFAEVLLDVAENPRASHRSRLRAVQAAIRPVRRAVAILPKLQKAGDGSLQTHLESLLMAFCQRLSAEHFGRLAGVLVELTGPAAKTTSDRVRACEAALTVVTDAMGMLSELKAMEARRAPSVDMNDPERRRRLERAARELAEMKARTQAELEQERRGGKRVR